MREKGVPVDKLLAAADDANAALKSSDAAWEHLRPLVQPASDAELAAIKAYYRSGITDGWERRPNGVGRETDQAID